MQKNEEEKNWEGLRMEEKELSDMLLHGEIL